MKTLASYLPFVLVFNFLSAQKTLEVIKCRFGSYKKFELYCGDKIAYKLKGERTFHHHAIANMSDSLLLLDNDSVIKISELKAIRFKRGGNVFARMSLLFVQAGITLIYVNLLANFAYDKVLKVDPRILYAGVALSAGFVIFQACNTKRIRVNGSVIIKVFYPQYHKIGEPKSPL